MMSISYALETTPIPSPLSFPVRLEAMGTMEELLPKPTWKSRPK